MAHLEQFQFIAAVKAAFPGFFSAARTLEIGSLDINGSVRRLFDGGTYIGLDVAPGRGVDIVCKGQDFHAPDNSFDTVISCEAMEHNPEWKPTMVNMIRLCRPGGLVVMTCATTGRKEHGTTRSSPDDSPLTIRLGWEYYRNLTERDFRDALALEHDLEIVAFFANWASRDIYMVGFKRGSPRQPMQRSISGQSGATTGAPTGFMHSPADMWLCGRWSPCSAKRGTRFSMGGAARSVAC